MKTLKRFLLGTFVLFLVAASGFVLVLGYYGFVPGLSSVLGATKAANLGVDYSKADYVSFSEKLNGDVIPITTKVDPIHSISYSGSLDVDKDFTQEELSARLNYAKWKYMPVKNTQLKINSDGTVEFSANIVMANLPGFIAREGAGRYTVEDVTKGLDFIKAIKVDPPIYVKFKASVTDNSLDSTVEKLTVGKYDVPLDQVDINSAAEAMFRAITERAPTFNAKSVTFSAGKMHFTGTVPAQMMVEME